MKKFLKWLLITGGICFVVLIAAIIIIPQFIDVQKYKPLIEQKVSNATGRSFTLGDEIDISIFPWVGLKLTDLHLGSGAGFDKKDMVSVKEFEVRLKVMPLLSKKIEIKRFVMDNPIIYIEKTKAGTANWQGIGKKEQKQEKTDKTREKEKSSKDQTMPIKALLVNNLSITNCQLTYVDHGTGLKKQISNLNLNLKDISFEKPIGVSLDADIDGKPVSLKGKLGPIGKEPGKDNIALDFILKALEELEIKIDGNFIDPLKNPTIDLDLKASQFSLKRLFAAMNIDFPLKTKDPDTLEKVSLKTHIKGNSNSISISEGVLGLDDSKIIFSAIAKEFVKPDLKFNLKLDQIDLDRYLPDSQKDGKTSKQVASSPEKTTTSDSSRKKTDYGPLRKLILDGKIEVGKLKAHGATIENVDIHILAKNGIITINPLDLDLYQGSIKSKLVTNVNKNTPRTKLTINANNIQAEPLLKDTMEKELIAGSLKARIKLAMTGEEPDMIKQTLNGGGELLFTDGAIIGIDLTNLVQNIKIKSGLEAKSGEKPRTDFAKLTIPFSAKNGLIYTEKTSLISPLIRVTMKGKANLVNEELDLKVVPNFVATLKGQGDTKQRSGIMVPVLITGTFSSPKFRPDLKSMITKDLSKDVKALTKGLLKDNVPNTAGKSVKEDMKKQIDVNNLLNILTD